jgi:hypothetical protein
MRRVGFGIGIQSFHNKIVCCARTRSSIIRSSSTLSILSTRIYNTDSAFNRNNVNPAVIAILKVRREKELQ